ncbi:hypothetical protein PIB30_092102 [Stylosanthes scabra]|uniref:RNase H type-1 domain-containing protein n=1 Tax=Stylosanthes scabra TaxID=79078 RepID=A0ABU6WW01_9FABA|nr:hypothetical protein [Stylosanthes scabra]
MPRAYIPSWFEHRSKQASISFWFRGKFPAKALCLAVKLGISHREVTTIVTINGKKVSRCSGGTRVEQFFIFDLWKTNYMDHLDEMLFESQEWNHAKVSYNEGELLSITGVKEIGMHILKQKSSRINQDIRFTDPYRKRKRDDHDFLYSIERYIAEALIGSPVSTLRLKDIIITPWSPADPVACKVRCTAASVFEHRHGFGCVIRNYHGSWIKGCLGLLPDWSTFRCELFAIWRGLVLALECGCKTVICETNSGYAYRATQFIEKARNQDFDLRQKIWELLLLPWKVSFNLIARKGNSVADMLAKKGALGAATYVEILQPGRDLLLASKLDLSLIINDQKKKSLIISLFFLLFFSQQKKRT